MLTSEFSRALALVDEGKSEEAARILSGIVERLPRYAAARVALARAVALSGTPADALAEWSRADALVSGSGAVRERFRELADAMFSESGGRPGAAREAAVEHSAGEEATEQPAGEEAAEPLVGERAAEQPVGEAAAEPSTGAGSAVGAGDGEIAEAAEPASPLEPERDRMEAEWNTVRGAGSPEEAPEWRESPPAPEVSDQRGDQPPEWDSSFGESGDGSRADVDVDIEAPRDDFELDRLIDELQAARIVPRPDLDAMPAPDLSSDIEDVVSETLARIYATQKQFGEAARVYDRLAIENPDRAGEFEDKAAEMRRQL